MVMIFLELFLIFSISSLLGFLIETIYRSLQEKTIIKPGFLSGPYLPIYGTSALIFFGIAFLPIAVQYKFAIFIIVPNLLEWIVGEIFLRYYNIRLWDYTDEKFNYKGFVSLKYAFFWLVLAIIFYFILYPNYLVAINFFREHLVYYFFLGIFGGIMIVDIVASFSIASKVKLFLQEFNKTRLEKTVLDYRSFRRKWRRYLKKSLLVNIFERNFLPLSGQTIREFYGQLNKFIAKTKRNIRKTKKESR
jgi:uncharacterized membrane protein